MEVILLKDVEKLGDQNEIVTVKNGFGRNYLIPKKLAIIANATNRNILKDQVGQIEAKLEKMIDEFKVIEEKLKGVTIKVGAKAGTSGKIFGSVTNIQIANAIKDQIGIDIDRKKITLSEDVKNLGTYTAEANLHPKVKPQITFEVIAD